MLTGAEIAICAGLTAMEAEDRGWVTSRVDGNLQRWYWPAGALAEALEGGKNMNAHNLHCHPPHGETAGIDSAELPSSQSSQAPAPMPAVADFPRADQLLEAELIVQAFIELADESIKSLDVIFATQIAERWPDAKAIEQSLFRLNKEAAEFQTRIQKRLMVASVPALMGRSATSLKP